MTVNAATEENLLVRIREETKDQHQRLENDLAFPNPDLTLERYCAVLSRFYGYYVPWEDQLEPWIAELRSEGICLPPKSPEIAADLDYFGIDRSRLRFCETVPAFDGLQAAIGSLYVREGAALGGQYISRALRSRLGLSDANGYRFFVSAGRDVGQDWKGFQKVMLRYSSAESDDRIIASARSTFENIRHWLCAAA